MEFSVSCFNNLYAIICIWSINFNRIKKKNRMPLKEKLIRKSFAHKRQQLQKSFTFRVAFWSNFHACPQVSNSSMESHSENGLTPSKRKRERDKGKIELLTLLFSIGSYDLRICSYTQYFKKNYYYEYSIL